MMIDIQGLKELWKKQYNYTLEDRIEIINIHRQIIKEIIPTYKKYIDEGRIELTTSAYYHSILPILIDLKASTKIHSQPKAYRPRLECWMMQENK